MPIVKKFRLQKSFRAAQTITRQYAKSFYFASITLPRFKKKAAYAVYAFCRFVDDSIDQASYSENKAEISRVLRQKLEQLYSDNLPHDLMWAEAFNHTVHLFNIPKNYFEDLIYGVELDAKGSVHIQTWSELKNYCYYVASVVGLIMSQIFGLQDTKAKEQAIALGIAMQLTNILRDVKEDYQMHRIYLPADELIMYQVDLQQGFNVLAWKKYAAFFTKRARQYYDESERGIGFLAADGSQLTVWLMRWIYAAILDEIEKNHYDVAFRHRVNFLKKLKLVFKAYRSYKRSLCDPSQQKSFSG